MARSEEKEVNLSDSFLPDTKVCRKCGIEKPIDSFSRRGEGKVKRRINIDCKECISKEAKVIRDLRKTAPPVPEVCDCCGKVPTGPHRKALQLDHCHKTGQFRGWICDSCNVSISRAGDTLEGVQNLVRYLSNHYVR